jgi:hypothetical protein
MGYIIKPMNHHWNDGQYAEQDLKRERNHGWFIAFSKNSFIALSYVYIFKETSECFSDYKENTLSPSLARTLEL